jgi:hypothetical protein
VRVDRFFTVNSCARRGGKGRAWTPRGGRFLNHSPR